MMKLAVRYGVYVGVATGAWMFLEFFLGLHQSDSIGRWSGCLSLLFPLIAAFFLVRHEPVTSWSSALGQGVVFGASGGLVGAVAIFCYFALLNPGFTVDGQAVDPTSQALIGLFGALVLGILLVPIMRVFARSRPAND